MSTVRGDAAMSRDEALAEVERVASDVFGYSQLRPGQADAMAALLAGHDVLLVMPTGSGKSAVYQVPGLILQGPTVVVSPIIALQRDQVEGLRDHGESAEAYAVNSTMKQGERREAWEHVGDGDNGFLFLAPEQLANPEVLEQVRELNPSIVAVDEAHSVSAWGHDFRPDYLRLGEFIDAIGHPRIIALTATAAPPVRDDIVERLRMQDPEVVVRGFSRPNIELDVVRVQSDADKREAVLLRTMSEVKPAVLYTATRKDTEEYAQAAAELGLRAAAYHAGMKGADRDEVQRAFMADELDVIVATNAFGMGIDKPDIRTVIHAAVPESPDSYYQEVGRVGRDGKPSLAVLYYRPEDLGLRKFFSSSIPKGDDVEVVADALRRVGGGTGTQERKQVRELTGLGPQKTGRIVNLLEDVDEDERENPEQAAARAVEMAESRRQLERSRIEMMRGYAETTGCRRQYILAYFGEVLPEPCGNCDTCKAGSAQEVEELTDLPFPLHSHVRHPEFGDGVVMSYETDPDRITVLFEESGYRTLSLETVRENGLLEQVD